MRCLMWFTIGFAFSCGLLAYGCPQPALLIPLIAAMVCWVAGRKRKNFRRAALILFGCLLGFVWYRQYGSFYLNRAMALDGKTEDLSIRITDYSYDTTYGTGADGAIALGGKTYQVRAYLDGQLDLCPGDRVEGTFRFRLTTPDGMGTYHAGKGIFLLAYQAGEAEITSAAEQSWRDFPARLRRQIQTILTDTFPEDTAPFAKALLLGDTFDLDYQTDTAFKVSGIRHVVAVSGLHVSILFALLGTLTFHRRYLLALLGFPALLLFAAVAGFTPSVNRACIMWGLILLAQLVNREYDGPTALSFAVLVMLLFNPLVITSVSFQLSVASVAGIFLFHEAIYTWLMDRIQPRKKPKEKSLAVRWLCTSVSISLSAMVLTTPLCAWYFGTVSLVGVLTNLLTLWLISAIFYGLMAVCLLSLLWSWGAWALAWLVSWPIRYVLLTAKLLARFPLAAVYTRSPYITAWLVFAYVLLAVFLVKRKKPLDFICCVILGLCMALTASVAEPMLDDVRLTVLNVGQGQCLLLQSQGRTYMVDCGGDSDEGTADIAAETLLSQGISRLDGLILTHLDRDHAGAAENLLSRIDTELLILPPEPSGLPTRGKTVYASQDLQLTFGDTVITIYAPQYPGTGNENSVCVLFESEKCDILITGDRNAFGERMLLRKAELPDVDVLIAGHHGSKYSTCEELLQAVTPETVCISAGEDNPFGHPSPALLQRLNQFGCNIYRTDRHGTIIIRRR